MPAINGFTVTLTLTGLTQTTAPPENLLVLSRDYRNTFCRDYFPLFPTENQQENGSALARRADHMLRHDIGWLGVHVCSLRLAPLHKKASKQNLMGLGFRVRGL